MRKRKKILTRITLCVLLVATLIPMFSLFSSAAIYDFQSLYPKYLYYWDYVADNYERPTAYWNTPTITSQDRIAFGIMYSNGHPWHIAPYVQGQQGFTDQVLYYNEGNDSLENNFGVATSVVASNAFETWISYNTGSSGTIEFLIILKLRDGVSWNYDWKPMYCISLTFIDRDGKYEGKVPAGTRDVMSVFAQGLIKVDTITTQTYPFIDCGVLTRYYTSAMNDNIAGINLKIEEYYYPKDIAYPTSVAAFENNLYQFDGIEGKFTSYPLKYYFLDNETEKRLSYQSGFQAGRQEGYTDGYQKGIKEGEDYNAVNGLVALAQVPGALVSNMLSFDFFGVNLANFVKFIFTLIIIAFILVVFFKFLL